MSSLPSSSTSSPTSLRSAPTLPTPPPLLHHLSTHPSTSTTPPSPESPSSSSATAAGTDYAASKTFPQSFLFLTLKCLATARLRSLGVAERCQRPLRQQQQRTASLPAPSRRLPALTLPHPLPATFLPPPSPPPTPASSSLSNLLPAPPSSTA